MNEYECTIHVTPRVKERPRLRKNGKGAYTPKATLEYEARVREAYQRAGGPQFGETYLEVHVTYFKNHSELRIRELEDHENESKLRGDLDNYVKATLDALNGVAWVDDKWIKRVVVEAV